MNPTARKYARHVNPALVKLVGVLSVMGDRRMRASFEPLLDGCTSVPFGDLEALEKSLASHRAAGFLVEPVQAEGGVVLPPPGYLRGARDLCSRTGTLLIMRSS